MKGLQNQDLKLCKESQFITSKNKVPSSSYDGSKSELDSKNSLRKPANRNYFHCCLKNKTTGLKCQARLSSKHIRRHLDSVSHFNKSLDCTDVSLLQGVELCTGPSSCNLCREQPPPGAKSFKTNHRASSSPAGHSSEDEHSDSSLYSPPGKMNQTAIASHHATTKQQKLPFGKCTFIFIESTHS